MKTISIALAAHYEQETTTLACLWKVVRRDGQVFGFTDHDELIVYDGVTYEVSSVFDVSAVSTRSELNVDSMEAKGILAETGITAADIEAGLWDGAQVTMMEVNYADLSMGANILRFGDAGEIRREGQQYVAEVRGLMQHLQNTIGRLVTATCPYDLGDADCKVDLEALRVSGSVTAVESQRLMTDSSRSEAVDYFQFGTLTWTSGANLGLEMEVKAFALGGEIEFQLDMPYEIQVGDDYTMVPGCDKVGRLGKCKLVYDNYVNFGGFEDVPGQHKTLLVGGQ